MVNFKEDFHKIKFIVESINNKLPDFDIHYRKDNDETVKEIS